jgi:predicted Zn-dependent protease
VIPCPACHKAAAEAPTCSCGADLRLPLLLDRIGRLCFNRGIELAQTDPAQAENQLCAACALMPLRPEAHRALGKLRAQAGRLMDAAFGLQLALKLSPEDPEARRALAEVERLARRERRLLLAAPAVLAMLTAGAAALFFYFR